MPKKSNSEKDAFRKDCTQKKLSCSGEVTQRRSRTPNKLCPEEVIFKKIPFEEVTSGRSYGMKKLLKKLPFEEVTL